MSASTALRFEPALHDVAEGTLDFVEVLHRGPGHVLHRARWAHGEGASVLVLVPTSEQQEPQLRSRMRHALGLKEQLDPSFAATPLYETLHRGLSVLVMHDPGGWTFRRLMTEPLELRPFLEASIALARTLERLHQAGLVHKDVRPENILFDANRGRAWMRGFGLTSRLTRERQPPGPPEIIGGSLEYMAPEQTGRMNRSVDRRSDLYSLGVTFYEMLAGRLPFEASDALEWVHSHVAREPTRLSRRAPQVPAAVSAIVMKLLRKAAEDRYQTAEGLRLDLVRCLEEFDRRGSVRSFPLGRGDVAAQILPPERLYGRSAAIGSLTDALERVAASGRSELVLVSGYSGVGKSAVVNELHRPLLALGGLFAAGKFDQHRREVPYATLAQALGSLVEHVLSTSDRELEAWRKDIVDALGDTAVRLAGLLPKLSLVTGVLAALPELSGPEARNRFYLCLVRFLQVFARQGQPLVLVIDDLQWVDEATLGIFERLALDPGLRNVLLVGTYRDNEVDADHPLATKIRAIAEAGGALSEVSLGPLRRSDLRSMLAEVLRARPRELGRLPAIVHEKTGGNPFFAIQFIGALADEKLLVFEAAERRWTWDERLVAGRSVTDGVVALLLQRLSRLPTRCMALLGQLACMGVTSIEAECLAKLVALESSEVREDLAPALRAGLVLLTGDAFGFAHDGVSEAVYGALGDAERRSLHRDIALRAVARLDDPAFAGKIFDIAGQFNRGGFDEATPAERAEGARVNLLAGQKARLSSAYATARDFMAAGLRLLAFGTGPVHDELGFALGLEEAECAFLCGDIEGTHALISGLLERAQTTLHKASAYRLRIELQVVTSQNASAAESAVEALRLLGIDLAVHPDEAMVQRAYERVWQTLGDRPIARVRDLPPMTDERMLAAMRILAETWPPAYFTDFNLVTLVVCEMVTITLRHGLADASHQGLALLGWLMGPAFGRYAEGYEIARLATGMAKDRNPLDFARTADTMGLTAAWTRPLGEAMDWWRTAYRTGRTAGDLYFSCYSSAHVAAQALVRGRDLAEDWAETREALGNAERIGFRDGVSLVRVSERTMAALRGMTRSLADFSDDAFDGDAFEQDLTVNPMPVVATWHWIRKTMLFSLAGEHERALEAASYPDARPWGHILQPHYVDHHLYAGLSIARLLPTVEPGRVEELASQLRAHQAELQTLASGTGSATFSGKAVLLAAELAAHKGRTLEALQLFEEAIAVARQNGFLNDLAAAHEAAAMVHARWGLETGARAHLEAAIAAYRRWGALAKVHDLEARHPEILRDADGPLYTASALKDPERLDLASVIGVAETLSAEMSVDRLTQTLMRIALEQAGAERGTLLVVEEGELGIAAEASTGAAGEGIVVRLEPGHDCPVPHSVVLYAQRTNEVVLLADAWREGSFADDPFIRERRTRSVLCLPVASQGKLVGILYLENDLSPGAFSPRRVSMLKLIASQAAISIENARLYRSLAERDAKFRRLFDADIIGILTWQLDGLILDANDAFLAMIGRSRQDLEAGVLRWTDLTPAEWRETDNAVIAGMSGSGRVPPYEKEFLHASGRRVPVLIGAAAFDEPRNQGVAFALDLTRRKEGEEALASARADLAHLNRVSTVGHMSASIAHEISQPVAAALTNTQAALRWLSAEPPNVEKALETIERIARNGSRAAQVIERIRAMIRKAPSHQESLDLATVVRELLPVLGPEVTRHDVALVTDLQPGLPAIQGDPVQLQQVVLNLVVNAVEAMATLSRTGRRVMIRTSASDGAGISLTVEDTGPGLTAEWTAGVLKPFQSTKPQGLGLGLAICRSIVEAHGGRLSARNRAEGGAAFEVWLPAAALSSDAGETFVRPCTTS